jgi:hypothetical protein
VLPVYAITAWFLKAIVPASILIFGHDEYLLQSREWVLEKHGYTVRTAADLTAAARILTDEEIALVILCQTLSLKENESISDLAGALGRPVKLLAITPKYEGQPAAKKLTVLRQFPEPEIFLAAVRAAL